MERSKSLPRAAAIRRAVDPEAVRAIPLHILQHVVALPYAFEGERLQVAVADLADIYALDELRLASSHPIDLELAPRAQIERELAVIAKREGPGLPDVGDLPVEPVDLVDALLTEADADNASDIHLVPREGGLLLRLRIDGVVRICDRCRPRPPPASSPASR